MATPQLLTRAYHVLITAFVDSGRALHYTELGAALDIPPAVALEEWMRRFLGIHGDLSIASGRPALVFGHR